MEKIKLAAIKYHTKDEPDVEKMLTGVNHSDIISLFSELGIRQDMRVPNTEKQGFITTEDRYVDRREALEIALKTGQLKERPQYRDYLISQDLIYKGDGSYGKV